MAVRILSALLVLLLIAILVVVFVRPAETLLGPTGRVVIVAYAIPVPGRDAEQTMGLGVDNVMLQGALGDEARASLFTRRVLLNSNDIVRHKLLEASVPVGSYGGVQFTLKSPELRNAWEGEEAPQSVTLHGDQVVLGVPYSVTEETTTAILLGFETLQALHENEQGNVYLPVVQTETRTNATIVDEGDGIVRIEGGVITASATYGMDWDQDMKLNFRARTKTTPTTPQAPPVPIVDEAAATTTLTASTTTAATSSTSTTEEAP